MVRLAAHWRRFATSEGIGILLGSHEPLIVRGAASLDLFESVRIAECPDIHSIVNQLSDRHNELELWCCYEELRAKGVFDDSDAPLTPIWSTFDLPNTRLDDIVDPWSTQRWSTRIDSRLCARQVAKPTRVELVGSFEGERPFLGPLIADANLCFDCLGQNIRSQSPVLGWLETQEQSRKCWTTIELTGRPAESVPTITEPLVEFVRSLLVEWSSNDTGVLEHPLAGVAYSLDIRTGEIEKHQVAGKCRCGKRDATVVDTDSGEPSTQIRRGTGFRRDPSSVVYKRLESIVDPLTGPIVYNRSREICINGLAPVYLSAFKFVPTHDLETYASPFLQVCAGKGWTDDDSKMSALGEAVERWASLQRAGSDPVTSNSVTSLLAMKSQGFIEPRQLHLLSDLQLADHQLQPGFRAAKVCAAGRELSWTEASSMSGESATLVPTAQFFANVPQDLGSDLCVYSSNGCASGSTLAEAQLQGLLELVERDALAIWWYNRLEFPEFNLADLEFEHSIVTKIDVMRSVYTQHGYQTWVLDITHDIGIPVAVAVALHTASGRFFFGFGCHLSSSLAVSRALCELNQLVDNLEQPRSMPWDAVGSMDTRFLYPAQAKAQSGEGARERGDGQSDTFTLSDALGHVVEKLRQVGVTAFCVDKSRPEVPLCVAHILAPGLRHPWPSFAPGRLYDVPVALGMIERPCAESALNPVPLLI